MIVIRYTDEDGQEQEIRASGLGDLGWQLDNLGADSATEDDRFQVLEVRLEE